MAFENSFIVFFVTIEAMVLVDAVPWFLHTRLVYYGKSRQTYLLLKLQVCLLLFLSLSTHC